MLGDKPPAYSVHSSNSHSLPTHTALPPAIKRVPRHRWILLSLGIVVIAFIFFPPHVMVHTWETSVLPPEIAFVNWNQAMPPGGRLRLWQGQMLDRFKPNSLGRPGYGRSDLPNHGPFGWPQELSASSFEKIHNTLQSLTNAHYSGHENKNYLTLSDRIVPKAAPVDGFKPLPVFPSQPDTVYQNVRPTPHELTSDPRHSRFMTYLPHSGFHNQRIEIMNAFKLAKLLKRTLILPEIRLGRPLAWRNSSRLAHDLEYEMKHWKFDCAVPSVDKSKLEDCDSYTDWTPVQVDYMMNISALVEEQPVVDRIDLRESWLWNTLKLVPGDWFEVKDDSRYSYQIYESDTIPRKHNSKYKWRLNIDDLEEYSDVRLLSFGSLFGSDRIVTKSAEMGRWNQKVQKNQLPNVPILKEISNEIAEHLGGRGRYIGLHLRVGNLLFRTQAPQVMPEVFYKLCRELLNLSEDTIQELFIRYEATLRSKTQKLKDRHHQRALDQSSFDTEQDLTAADLNLENDRRVERWDQHDVDHPASYSEEGHPSAPQHRPTRPRIFAEPSRVVSSKKVSGRGLSSSSSKTCRGELYTEPHLRHLNLPIYVATDVSHPDQHPHLSIFFKTFPCIFLLDDFKDTSLKSLEPLRSGSDGLKLNGFLYPMLEAMVASKGLGIVGTPRSTLSSYAVSILHPAYLSDSS